MPHRPDRPGCLPIVPPVNDRGVTLVLILLFTSAIAVIGVCMGMFVTIQNKIAENNLQHEKAFYIAEAGVHHALFKVRKNTTWTAGFSSQSFGEGAYSASLVQPTLASELVITSTGTVGKSKATVTGRSIYRIATVCGTGHPGYNGDGIPATTAELHKPCGVCVDMADNLYITDTHNSRIRKIDHLTGIITTIAGTNQEGFSGDGGLATLAKLQKPQDIFIDSAGNIYIADTENGRIRKIDHLTGIIYTVAGGGALKVDGILSMLAELKKPTGVFVDGSGNLYIAERDNNKIRKVSSGTGIIYTVAGTESGGYNGDNLLATAATLNKPNDVFVTGNGDIYIADMNNNRVRKVSAADGKIYTVAGTGWNGYNGEGIAATLAKLDTPTGVGLDPGGNIYLADMKNECLRRVNISNGIINNFAGIGHSSGYSGDGGVSAASKMDDPVAVCQDSGGNFYIADQNNHCIRKVSLVKVLWSAG